jgi:nitrogen fixation NifU-like protein
MDLYREEILDHYKHPRNFGHLPQASIVGTADNVSCGDTISLEIALTGAKGEEIISDIRFSGTGCAISQASASLLTEHVKGKTVGEIRKLTPEHIYELLGVTLTPSRVKCALLSYEALVSTISTV